MNQRPPVRFATDFSGMDATAFYMLLLFIPFVQVFASEIEEDLRAFLRANHTIEHIFEDVRQRPKEWDEQLDMYVAGPPCQSFSRLGKRKGLQDVRGQFDESIAFIVVALPKCFILENGVEITKVQGGFFFVGY